MTQPAEIAAPSPLASDPHDARAFAAAVLSEPQATPVTAADGTSASITLADGAAGPAPAASHDSPPPQGLIDFMLQGWAPPTGALPAPIEHAEVFRARRRALSAQYPGETIVVPSGHLKVRSNDTHYRFRPSSDFYYLTGNVEPDCVLVLEPTGLDGGDPQTPGPAGLDGGDPQTPGPAGLDGGHPQTPGHRDVLFVEANPGHSDATFFTDRIKGALWVGARLGVPESHARFGVDACRPLSELGSALAAIAAGGRSRALRGTSAIVDGARSASDGDKALAVFLAETRMIKDALEVEELRAVVASTRRGFEDVIKRLPRARSEREVEGIFAMRARVEGNDVGYGTIAAAGAHACVLHYRDNAGKLDPSELLLLDAGVEGNSLYTADITRTLPISGRFTRPQRTIYKLVYKAQKAALALVKPGNDFMEPNQAAMRVLAEGLERLGILDTTAEEALKEEKQFYKRYSLHNISHMLGLDVHDCAEARKETYKLGKLRPGMVLTVEPGLYFQEDDLTVPEPYRGIGVRIEDDVVVTEDGYENLSAKIPSQVDDVEAWMARLRKKAKKG